MRTVEWRRGRCDQDVGLVARRRRVYLDAAGRDEEAHVVGGDAAKLLGEAAFERLLTKGGEVSGDCEVGAENVKVGSPGRRGWQQWRR